MTKIIAKNIPNFYMYFSFLMGDHGDESPFDGPANSVVADTIAHAFPSIMMQMSNGVLLVLFKVHLTTRQLPHMKFKSDSKVCTRAILTTLQSLTIFKSSRICNIQLLAGK